MEPNGQVPSYEDVAVADHVAALKARNEPIRLQIQADKAQVEIDIATLALHKAKAEDVPKIRARIATLQELVKILTAYSPEIISSMERTLKKRMESLEDREAELDIMEGMTMDSKAVMDECAWKVDEFYPEGLNQEEFKIAARVFWDMEHARRLKVAKDKKVAEKE